MSNPDYSLIPESTIRTLTRYVEKRIQAGGFLTHVLCSDLFGAYSYADERNTEALPLIVKYIYNELPGGCWGSPEAVDQWLSGSELYEED